MDALTNHGLTMTNEIPDGPEIDALLTEQAYQAGVFDGEGSLFIQNPHGNVWCLRVAMQMSHQFTIERFRNLHGGSLYRDDRLARLGLNRKTMWCWSTTGQTAVSFLEFISPFSVVKFDEIEVALEYAAQRPGRRGHDGDQAVIAMAYRNKLQELKRAG